MSRDHMSLAARAAARPGSRGAAIRIRRGSLAVLVLTVLEYGLGQYVNLYVSVPAADRGGDLGSAIVNGPAALGAHAVIGLLLGLAALGVLAQAVMARRPGAIAASALGLFALAFADVTGASFTSSGDAADSMGMAVLTGAALLCYAANLYLLRRPPGDSPPYEGPSGDSPSGDSPSGDSPSGDSPSGEGPSGDSPPYEGDGTTGAGKSRV